MSISWLLLAASAVVVVLAGARAPRSGPTLARLEGSGWPGLPPGLRAPRPARPGIEPAGPTSHERDAGIGEASCLIDDPGFGAYERWERLDTGGAGSPAPGGRVLLPTALAPGPFDLVIHFHGSEAARQLLAEAGLPVVLAGVDAGEGGAVYEQALADPAALESLVTAIEQAATRKAGGDCRAAHVILSSWSAGYGAIRQILQHDPERPSALVLLDSLYASYLPGTRHPDDAQMAPFVAAAERAAAGNAPLVLTHSDIDTPGYASTAETADYLIAALRGQRRYAGMLPAEGVEERTRFAQGLLEIRGYTGGDAPAHCANLRMLPGLLRELVLPALAPPAAGASTPQ
ncbi:MAG: hypothetical protein IT373_16045 [Polyangiaceae bacterium]|nr:hypothetical protein [Polyangiaceae bacterium]